MRKNVFVPKIFPNFSRLKQWIYPNFSRLERWICSRFSRLRPWILAFILTVPLSGCADGESAPEHIRTRFQEMEGCTMEAVLECEQDGSLWQARLRCEYVPDGSREIEVLAPESIAGVKAVLDPDTFFLRYEGKVLNAGTLSPEEISPVSALPRMMDALRGGWLTEENIEILNGVPCARLALEPDGNEQVLVTLWLRQDDGIPLRGELASHGQTFLTAEFAAFDFRKPDNANLTPQAG